MSDDLVESSWRVLQAASLSLPHRRDLAREMVDARAAQERGYFLPDEDERLRRSYRRYLEARQALLEMVLEFQPHLPELDLRVFAIAFGAASSLMASASLLVELTRGRPVVHRKTFTQIFPKILRDSLPD